MENHVATEELRGNGGADALGSLLPSAARELIAALEEAGFEAWAVGGFVRDAMLGRPSHDVDLATSARWQDVQAVAEGAGMRTHETGVKHGTLTVTMPADGPDASLDDMAIEVTTYRHDGPYQDGRHPDAVSFVSSIEEDLARRDFTMNAMAYHPARGLLDPFGGQSDLADGAIRIVGEPDARFAEDGLRILRACRFASQLGFDIDEGTFEAMMRQKSLLGRVSTERITHELDEFVMGGFVRQALMRTHRVLAFVLPELVAMADCAQDNPYHIYDVLEHTAHVMEQVPPTRLLRWAALCHDMGKPAASFCGADGVQHFYGHAHVSCQMARGMMSRLLMRQGFQDQVVALVRAHDDHIAPTPRAVRKALSRLDGNVELFEALCALKRADALAHSERGKARVEQAEALRDALDAVLAEGEAFTVKALAIDGHDVLSLGCEEGPQVGALLQDALGAVIDGEVRNEREELLTFLQAGIKKTAEGS